MNRGTHPPDDEVKEAYRGPFPTVESRPGCSHTTSTPRPVSRSSQLFTMTSRNCEIFQRCWCSVKLTDTSLRKTHCRGSRRPFPSTRVSSYPGLDTSSQRARPRQRPRPSEAGSTRPKATEKAARIPAPTSCAGSPVAESCLCGSLESLARGALAEPAASWLLSDSTASTGSVVERDSHRLACFEPIPDLVTFRPAQMTAHHYTPHTEGWTSAPAGVASTT